MLAGTTRRLLTRAPLPSGMTRPISRAALPSIASQAHAARTFSSCTTVRNSAESDTFLPKGEAKDEAKDGDDKISSFERLEYLLSESSEPSQSSLVKQLPDELVEKLPIVISSSRKWKPVDARFTLPKRDRPDSSDDAFSAYRCADYVYNTFSFPSLLHLKRFHTEVAEHLDSGFAKVVNAVLLFDSRSRTLTIGLPAYVGIQPPYPAKRNTELVQRLLAEYRAQETPAAQKRELAKQLRSLVIERGFKKNCNSLSMFIFALYDKVRRASLDDVLGTRRFAAEAYPPGSRRRVEASLSADADAKATGDLARNASQTGQKQRGKGEKGEKKLRQPKKQGPNLADRLRADDPKLPEAGTFVAADGDAHRESKGVDALQESVPFPKPSAEEMGIEKPTATEEVSADDPKLPEAGTFVAQDGDAHKASKGVDALEESVPFPKPRAEEMGIKKPTET